MTWFRFATLQLIVVSILSCGATWAGESFPNLDATYPSPYEDKDNGRGATPGITLNSRGLLPDWLSLSVQHRSRYETLNKAFRLGATGSDQTLALRTLAQATLNLQRHFKVQLELQDSRAFLNDSGSVVNSTIVNTAELLEANLQWTVDDLFQEGSRTLLRAGRLTMDFGKRRLVARNRFRNTKNGFTGIDGIWKGRWGESARVMFTLPVNREPVAASRLLLNDAAFDEETFDRVLWGLFAATPNLPWQTRGELYLFGYYEEDSPTLATRNRELYTPGWRWFRSAKSGQFDFEWETVLQVGTSRATTAPADTRDLDHFAHFHHMETGYTFTHPWKPRLVLAYDYASGDEDPTDGNQGGFFSLFGATVFDYGPTSIHRAFVRSNIKGPAVQLGIKPHQLFKAYLHYRAFWLAANRGPWAGNSGLSDTNGASGSFLGHLIYLSGTWQAAPNLMLEAGVVHRVDGEFQETVPSGPRTGDSTYSFMAVTLSF